MFLKNNIGIPCIFYKITNLYCPGCGVTRMLVSLLQFDLYQAFRYNCLLFLSIPFVLVLFVDFILKWLKGKKNYIYFKISTKTWLFLLIVTILFGIIRNIPFFDYLVPTTI